jgi:uncharacterized protein (UPF0332 family)
LNEISLLIARADRAIKSAELLLQETDYDSSISRSYYAMFYMTEAVLLTKKLKFSSHKSVIMLFNQNFIKAGIFNPITGRRLSKTFEKRLLSDYSIESQITREDAYESVQWVKEYIDEITNYLKENDYIK